MPRIKSKTTTFSSKLEFERALDTAALKQLKLEKIIADYNAEKASQDKAHKARVQTLRATINEALVACESYAAHNREELLGDRQTGETKLASFGFRKSPGIVKTLNAKWTFTKALAALKSAGKSACVKVTETLDKQAVKREIPEAELPQFGLRLDYPEDFWAEAKKVTETPANRLQTS